MFWLPGHFITKVHYKPLRPASGKTADNMYNPRHGFLFAGDTNEGY